MANTCQKHYSEIGAAMCRRCGLWYCASCLVFAFGPKKPPFCTTCAIAASGVRTGVKLPPARSPREIKREMRAWQRANRHRPAAEPAADAASLGSEREPVEAKSGSQFDQEVAAWENGDVLYQDVASGH